MGRLLVVFFLLGAVSAAPRGKRPVPLRDLKARFVRGGKLERSRMGNRPGLWVAGKRHRGLAITVPGRIGFDVDRNFARLTIKVAVLDGASQPARFLVIGDGKTITATPPLFPGAAPIELDVPLHGVILLELRAEGARKARAGWIGGKLYGREGVSLHKYRATAAEFSPQAYPQSFKRKVNNAIDRAVQYLRSQQQSDGTWRSTRAPVGTTALAALAMLKAGVPRTDVGIVGAFKFLRDQTPTRTYDTAVLLMAIEARYFPKGANPKDAIKTLPDDDQLWIQQLASWLVKQQGAGYPPAQRNRYNKVWRYPRGGYDLSCTQYALFGLAAANRCGFATSDVWLPALRFILKAQEQDGPAVEVSRYFRSGRYVRRHVEKGKARGFAYQLDGRPTGSMTSAGLCSLVLCQAALYRTQKYQENYRRRTRTGIRDALAWLEEYYDLSANPFYGTAWLNYYLFNLERVGVLLDQRYLGTRDWYREGCERFFEVQFKNGAFGGVIDTAFALLFMKKATVAPLTQTRK
ncbi:MAG: NPCBM/NEW2 domain-containing protein [Planctomycetota bacterium]|nr:NPCBM/NEW2 domain-containing protein [Planctomycetota bacterium]